MSGVSSANRLSLASPVGKSVLIIDDSLDILDLQRTVLELGGFEVFTARNGAEAFKTLSKIKMPNLILLDIQMKGVSGPEFLRKLEKKMPQIVKSVPIVFLSGVDEVPESKAAGFIRKPTDVVRFLMAVRNYIEMGRHAPYSS